MDPDLLDELLADCETDFKKMSAAAVAFMEDFSENLTLAQDDGVLTANEVILAAQESNADIDNFAELKATKDWVISHYGGFQAEHVTSGDESLLSIVATRFESTLRVEAGKGQEPSPLCIPI